MSNSEPTLVATCWTSAGGAVPGEGDQRSPFSLRRRITAVAEAGYVGMGFVLPDLMPLLPGAGGDGDFTDLGELAAAMDELGLTHREVELLEGWQVAATPEVTAATDALLLAAETLGASFVKAGPRLGPPHEDPRSLVGPLQNLADRAAKRGVRVALEPLPFSEISTLPIGAEIVHEAGREGLGLAVDYWHVFRAGTSFAELERTLRPSDVIAVELCDALALPQGDLFDDTRHRRSYCGEGDQDVPGFIEAMLALGFEGPWGVEILSAEHRALPLDEALAKARDTALACFPRSSEAG